MNLLRTPAIFVVILLMSGVALTPSHAELIRLDYTAIIGNPQWPYNVVRPEGLGLEIGDEVIGSLTFDTALAPEDSNYSPEVGLFFNYSYSIVRDSNFVTGGSPYNSPEANNSLDEIYIDDQNFGNYNSRIYIVDNEVPFGSSTQGFTQVDLYFVNDLLVGDTIEQDYLSLNGQVLAGSYLHIYDEGRAYDEGISRDFSAVGFLTSYKFSIVSVPEPGTLALLGLGLIGMAARRRKTV